MGNHRDKRLERRLATLTRTRWDRFVVGACIWSLLYSFSALMFAIDLQSYRHPARLFDLYNRKEAGYF